MNRLGIDTAEALTNATLGVVVSITAVHIFWPLFGWPVTATQSIAVTAIFWALSIARSFVVRRVFRSIQNG